VFGAWRQIAADASYERRLVPKMEVAAQHALGTMVAWAFRYRSIDILA